MSGRTRPVRFGAVLVLGASLSACGLTGMDPTGTAAMIQFEQHRQRSIAMQKYATSAQFNDEREEYLRQAIQYCRQNIEQDGCRDVVRDEARTMQIMRDMRRIGAH